MDPDSTTSTSRADDDAVTEEGVKNETDSAPQSVKRGVLLVWAAKEFEPIIQEGTLGYYNRPGMSTTGRFLLSLSAYLCSFRPCYF